MNISQPKPDSKKYSDLISEIEKGIIKIPKFQREFVWSIEKTAQLLDSILKGYPIGTFILWQTAERLNDVKTIGNLKLPDTPDGFKVQYVLDGQQRITSLYAAYSGAKLQKAGEKKITDYSQIYVDLEQDINDEDLQVITHIKPEGGNLLLQDVLNFTSTMPAIFKNFPDQNTQLIIHSYFNSFQTYDFSTVLLRKEAIESAIEVFTRINTGGQTLTLFEIMSAKTYDENQAFDMQIRWSEFIQRVSEKKYDGISNSIILSLLALILSNTKECKRKTILKLEKDEIIKTWDEAISALEYSIDYFRTSYGIPVSQLLPYDILLVPFAYFHFYQKEKPTGAQKKYLEEFFWRMSLSHRYSSSTESSLAQDIKRIDLILMKQRPTYDDIKLDLTSPKDLVLTDFKSGDSFCKAILCLLAQNDPRDFQDNGKVILDNSWLKVANSKNYHHFFPKSYLRKEGITNSNSLMNITFVSDHLNKRKIGSSAPALYIGDFSVENDQIGTTLKTHYIGVDGFGIESNDYNLFLKKRSEWLYEELQKRLTLEVQETSTTSIEEIIKGGESENIEFKSTLRYDLKRHEINKKLEFIIAKTVAAFMNSNGGTLLIGISDDGEILGLENDFNTLEKKNRDGFELQLIQVLKKYIGVEFSPYVKIAFETLNKLIVCIIKVSSSSVPVFVDDEGKQEFFVRVGCSSQPLTRDEQSTYEKGHF